MDGIGEVVGVVTNSSTLVGLSQDGMSQLCSDDDGVTWTSCLTVDVTEITSEANYVASIQQPFDDFIATSDDTMFSTYGFSHPEFDVTGASLDIYLVGQNLAIYVQSLGYIFLTDMVKFI